jgi:hypothetical protein
VEAAIQSILVMPRELTAAKNKELAALPSKKVPVFSSQERSGIGAIAHGPCLIVEHLNLFSLTSSEA